MPWSSMLEYLDLLILFFAHEDAIDQKRKTCPKRVLKNQKGVSSNFFLCVFAD